jgi:hypothetical protein
MPCVLIPIAGLAVRLGGTMKYLLPLLNESGKVTTLLQEHINLANALQWEVTALTRPDADKFTFNYLASKDSNNMATTKVIAVSAKDKVDVPTSTMNESVLVGQAKQKENDLTLMLMGDTYFFVNKANRCLVLKNHVYSMQKLLIDDEKTIAVLLLFPIRKEQVGKLGQVSFDESTKDVRAIVDKTFDCLLPYAWGAMMYKPQFMDFVVSEEPHLGYAIMPAIKAGWKVKVVEAKECEYYDCGTIQEYRNLLQRL